MKAYVMTSGTIFGLIVLAHIWRVTAEGPELARNPIYIITTLAAAGLTLWAWRVLRIMSRS